MTNRLLIDAAFPEETRVAIVDEDNKLQNMDREATSIKQLKGNIYLARIIRLEPSLQSAFINYGGDKHGFLPISDIHPDYYNIPEERKTDLTAVRFFNNLDKKYNIITDEVEDATDEDFNEENFLEIDSETGEPIIEDNAEIEDIDIDFSNHENENNDTIYGEEISDDESKPTRYSDFRKYKIEDVLKEGQCLLVQVLKEERGNKGVALTTYITLAGKYSVLMSNVEGKGGISKKITNIRDRKILRNILNTISPDANSSVIIRTAGVGKKPEEIFRDYVYLTRLWGTIKKVTLESEAPAFIHSEDDILKRSIRDLCDDSIREIIVEGHEAYKHIKSLVKVIMPEQKTTIIEHSDKTPIFYKYNIEDQIENLYLNVVNLPSGGSIVIDQTEALVAIDVNSGKSTKERSVEEMAVSTNIEAAKEIARQLRLRDIGGLIVIDFIDMMESRNRRAIEKAMRDATLMDKAKVQVDRITIFGLLEMSRQRVNSGLYERVNEKCGNCSGHGTVRSKYLVANNILRAIKYSTKERFVKVVNVFANPDVVNFMLNYKRAEIADIEKNYDIYIILSNDSLKVTNEFEIKKRDSLTDEEKMDLCPIQQMGKINNSFDDGQFYNLDDCEFNVNFGSSCYYNKSMAEKASARSQNASDNLSRKQQRKRTNSAKQRTSSGNNRKKKNNSGIFGKIFGIFGKK